MICPRNRKCLRNETSEKDARNLWITMFSPVFPTCRPSKSKSFTISPSSFKFYTKSKHITYVTIYIGHCDLYSQFGDHISLLFSVPLYLCGRGFKFYTKVYFSVYLSIVKLAKVWRLQRNSGVLGLPFSHVHKYEW